MSQLALERRSRLTRLSRRFRREQPIAEPGGLLHPLTALGLPVMLALATALVELAMHFVRRQFINPSSMGPLQLNPQAYWMVPVSNLLIFGLAGLPLIAAALFRWRRMCSLSLVGLFFLSTFAVLLTLRGLTFLACLTFATGLALQLKTRLLARPRRADRVVRVGLPASLALAACLAFFGYAPEKLGPHHPAPAGSPNVLFIVLDTVRTESLSVYGYNRDTSPNLTNLARQGVRFDHARTAAAWTLPSHASMFTGRWPYELSTRPDRSLDTAFPTLAEYLRDHGYLTAGFVGNTYFCNRWFGLARGFLHYEDVAVCLIEILRSSDMGRLFTSKIAPAIYTRDRPYSYFNRKDAATVNHDMLTWLDGQPKGKPFFAFLNYFDAHDPYISAAGARRHFGLQPETPEEVAALRDWLHVDKNKTTNRLLQMSIDGYDDGIAYLDDQIGQLFAALDSRALLQNTLIIITSDHGELHGEHGVYGHGSHLYSEVAGVPLLIAGPNRVPHGATVANPVSLRDLPTTVIDLLGFDGRSPFPGRSLASCWSPAQSPQDEFLLTETSDELSITPLSTLRARSLLHRGNLYVRNKDGSEELYNLASDPAESHNLTPDRNQSQLLDTFRTKMKEIDAAATVAEAARIQKHPRPKHHRHALATISAASPTPPPLPLCGPGELDLHD